MIRLTQKLRPKSGAKFRFPPDGVSMGRYKVCYRLEIYDYFDKSTWRIVMFYCVINERQTISPAHGGHDNFHIKPNKLLRTSSVHNKTEDVITGS